MVLTYYALTHSARTTFVRRYEGGIRGLGWIIAPGLLTRTRYTNLVRAQP